jgi:hypothetical protein
VVLPTTPFVLCSSLGDSTAVIALLHVPTLWTVYGVPHGVGVKRVVGQQTETIQTSKPVDITPINIPTLKPTNKIKYEYFIKEFYI